MDGFIPIPDTADVRKVSENAQKLIQVLATTQSITKKLKEKEEDSCFFKFDVNVILRRCQTSNTQYELSVDVFVLNPWPFRCFLSRRHYFRSSAEHSSSQQVAPSTCSTSIEQIFLVVCVMLQSRRGRDVSAMIVLSVVGINYRRRLSDCDVGDCCRFAVAAQGQVWSCCHNEAFPGGRR